MKRYFRKGTGALNDDAIKLTKLITCLRVATQNFFKILTLLNGVPVCYV